MRLKDKNQRAFVEGSWSDSGEEDDEKAKDEACLMDHESSKICLRIDLEPDKWIKDSGCSKHMTGTSTKLFSITRHQWMVMSVIGSNLPDKHHWQRFEISKTSLNIDNVEACPIA
ncbi:hypothetical protein Tco_0268809 [Tanacetum coccineum]